MMRPVTRLWLALWAGLMLCPLLHAGEIQPAGIAPTLMERQGAAVLSRVSALARVVQVQDHGSGAGATPLHSATVTGLVAPPRTSSPVIASAPRAVASAVLSHNFPTGPPQLS